MERVATVAAEKDVVAGACFKEFIAAAAVQALVLANGAGQADVVIAALTALADDRTD